ncbi:MAG: HD domain-containing protein [Phycisphaeraceae bacterium]|nr:HD domain-containing protein [Phycisphaeraceae bacterium]
MLRVLTANARPGMALAQPVLHPKQLGHVLLKPNAVLDQAALDKLREYRVPVLWIRYPALDFLARYVSPQIAAEHAKLTSTLATGFEEAVKESHGPMDFAPFADAVHGMLQKLIESPGAALFLQDMIDHDRPLLAHSSNVCFISLLLGLRLDGYLVDQRTLISPARAKRTESLGLGALLHDVGMLRLSPEAQARWIATQDLSDPDVRKHVTLGFDLLRGQVPPTAAAVALHHHQRYDGTGFPQIRRLDGTAAPLAGRQIHVFARIVAVAETFSRLRSPPGAAMLSVPAVRVLRRMLEMARRLEIDPVVYRALLTVIPAYSPGSMVQLSDGDVAVVTGWDASDPCRPTVRHVSRLDCQAGDESSLGPEIDLRQRRDLHIVAIDGVETALDNFGPLPSLRTQPTAEKLAVKDESAASAPGAGDDASGRSAA